MAEKPQFLDIFDPFLDQKCFLPLESAKFRKSKIGLRSVLVPVVLQEKKASGLLLAR